MNKKDGFVASIRTDLAIESSQMLLGRSETSNIEGINIKTEENSDGTIIVSTVEITDEARAEDMGKAVGTYITIESDDMKRGNVENHLQVAQILAEKIGELCSLEENDSILIVGLGNRNVTPDSLGPTVISKLLITRHIHQNLSENYLQGLRSVSSISPGVMGQTGIETTEIVKGVVSRIKPSLIIAIDALAARNISRINSTIQISNTGINPGAGVGNKRKGLTESNLGIPVMAIGVPTVVDAATFANDTLEKVIEFLKESEEDSFGQQFLEKIELYDNDKKYEIIKNILTPEENMFVTPKEVDQVVERLAVIISKALNMALHKSIDITDIENLLV